MALIEGEDYYIDKSGLLVFTAQYLLARGFCCGNGCRHCPYGEQQPLPSLKGKPEQNASADDDNCETVK
jgi:hypothetical protein